MTGRDKCKLLKEIRKEIADRNGIAFEPAECHFQGNCYGTCPKCDEEIKYLDAQLNKKAQMGGKVCVAGLKLDAVEVKPPFGSLREHDGIYQTMGIVMTPGVMFEGDDEDYWGDDSEDKKDDAAWKRRK